MTIRTASNSGKRDDQHRPTATRAVADTSNMKGVSWWLAVITALRKTATSSAARRREALGSVGARVRHHASSCAGRQDGRPAGRAPRYLSSRASTHKWRKYEKA